MRNLIIGLLMLLFLTQGLLMYHSSNFVKGEYDRSCDQIYDEKVWLDKCYIPYYTQAATLERVRNIEIVGVVIAIFYILVNKKKS